MEGTSLGIELTQVKKELEKEREEKFGLNIECDRLYRENNLLSSEVEDLKDHLAKAEEDEATAQDKIDELKEEIDYIKMVNDDAEKRRGKNEVYWNNIINGLKEELAEKENNNPQSDLNKSQTKQSTTLAKKVKELEAELSASKANASDEETKRREGEAMIDELKATVQRLTDADKDWRIKATSSKAIISDLSKKLARKETRTSESELQECRARELALDDKVEKLEAELYAVKRRMIDEESNSRDREATNVVLKENVYRLEKEVRIMKIEVKRLKRELADARGGRDRGIQEWAEKDMEILKIKVQDLAMREAAAVVEKEELNERLRRVEGEKRSVEEQLDVIVIRLNCGEDGGSVKRSDFKEEPPIKKQKLTAIARVIKPEDATNTPVVQKGKKKEGGGKVKKETGGKEIVCGTPHTKPSTQPPSTAKPRSGKRVLQRIVKEDAISKPNPNIDDPLSRISLIAPPTRGALIAPPVRPAIVPRIPKIPRLSDRPSSSLPSTNPNPSLPNIPRLSTNPNPNPSLPNIPRLSTNPKPNPSLPNPLQPSTKSNLPQHPPVPPPPFIPQFSGFNPPYGMFPPPPHLVMNVPPQSGNRRGSSRPPRLPPYVPNNQTNSWRNYNKK